MSLAPRVLKIVNLMDISLSRKFLPIKLRVFYGCRP